MAGFSTASSTSSGPALERPFVVRAILSVIRAVQSVFFRFVFYIRPLYLEELVRQGNQERFVFVIDLLNMDISSNQTRLMDIARAVDRVGFAETILRKAQERSSVSRPAEAPTPTATAVRRAEAASTHSSALIEAYEAKVRRNQLEEAGDILAQLDEETIRERLGSLLLKAVKQNQTLFAISLYKRIKPRVPELRSKEALYAAFVSKQVSFLLELMASWGPNKPDADGNTPLHHLCASGIDFYSRVLEWIALGHDVLLPNHEGDTPLHILIKSRQWKIVEAIVDKEGFSLKDHDCDAIRFLTCALDDQQFAIATKLLQKGAKIKGKDTERFLVYLTGWYRAFQSSLRCNCSTEGMVSILKWASENLDIKEYPSFYPLLMNWALEEAQTNKDKKKYAPDYLKHLILKAKEPASSGEILLVKPCFDKGVNAFYLACLYGLEKIAELTMDNKIPFDSFFNHPPTMKSPLDIVCEQDLFCLYLVFRDEGIDATPFQRYILAHLRSRMNYDRFTRRKEGRTVFQFLTKEDIKDLIQHPTQITAFQSLDSSIDKYNPPVDWQMLHSLIEGGVDLAILEEVYKELCPATCEKGYSLLQTLMQKKLDVTENALIAKGCKKETLSQENQIAAIIALIKRDGVDLNYQDKEGNTALMLSVNIPDYLPIRDALLKKGVDVTLKNKAGKTVFDKALASKDWKLCLILLEKMPKDYRKALLGTFPIKELIAFVLGKIETWEQTKELVAVKELLAVAKKEDWPAVSLLHSVLIPKKDNKPIINWELTLFLIENGISLDLLKEVFYEEKADREKLTSVLHLSVMSNELAVAKALVRRGVPITLQDKEGNTPLAAAVFQDTNSSMLRVLLEATVDFDKERIMEFNRYALFALRALKFNFAKCLLEKIPDGIPDADTLLDNYMRLKPTDDPNEWTVSALGFLLHHRQFGLAALLLKQRGFTRVQSDKEAKRLLSDSFLVQRLDSSGRMIQPGLIGWCIDQKRWDILNFLIETIPSENLSSYFVAVVKVLKEKEIPSSLLIKILHTQFLPYPKAVFALLQHHYQVGLDYLAKQGIDFNIYDDFRHTPLVDLTNQLLERERTRGSEFDYWLQDLFLTLLNGGADPKKDEETKKSMKLVLQKALKNDCYALADKLIEMGIFEELTPAEKEEFMKKALEKGKVSTIELLLEKGQPIPASSLEGKSLMQIGLKIQSLKMVERAIAEGRDLNSTLANELSAEYEVLRFNLENERAQLSFIEGLTRLGFHCKVNLLKRLLAIEEDNSKILFLLLKHADITPDEKHLLLIDAKSSFQVLALIRAFPELKTKSLVQEFIDEKRELTSEIVEELFAVLKDDPELRRALFALVQKKGIGAFYNEFFEDFSTLTELKGPNGKTFSPAQWVAFSGNTALAQKLLDSEVDFNGAVVGSHPLSLAIAYGHIEMVRFLIEEASVDVNAEDSNKKTPLNYLFNYYEDLNSENRAEIFRLLVEGGLDPKTHQAALLQLRSRALEDSGVHIRDLPFAKMIQSLLPIEHLKTFLPYLEEDLLFQLYSVSYQASKEEIEDPIVAKSKDIDIRAIEKLISADEEITEVQKERVFTMIQTLLNNGVNIAAPANPVERREFYQDIISYLKALLYVIREKSQEEGKTPAEIAVDKADVKMALAAIVGASKSCAMRWQTEFMQAYRAIVGGQFSEKETAIAKALELLRLEIANHLFLGVRSMIEGGGTNTHMIGTFLTLYGEIFGILGGKKIRELHLADKDAFNVYSWYRQFIDRYNVKHILYQLLLFAEKNPVLKDALIDLMIKGNKGKVSQAQRKYKETSRTEERMDFKALLRTLYDQLPKEEGSQIELSLYYTVTSAVKAITEGKHYQTFMEEKLFVLQLSALFKDHSKKEAFIGELSALISNQVLFEAIKAYLCKPSDATRQALKDYMEKNGVKESLQALIEQEAAFAALPKELTYPQKLEILLNYQGKSAVAVADLHKTKASFQEALARYIKKPDNSDLLRKELSIFATIIEPLSQWMGKEGGYKIDKEALVSILKRSVGKPYESFETDIIRLCDLAVEERETSQFCDKVAVDIVFKLQALAEGLVAAGEFRRAV